MKSEIQVKQVFSSFSAFKKRMRMAKLEKLIENAGFLSGFKPPAV